MQKYRIKQKGNRFYPQYKGLLFWHNVSDYRVRLTDVYPIECRRALFHRGRPRLQSFCDAELDYVEYWFDNLEEARRYLKKYLNRTETAYMGHNIKEFDNGKFVDLTCNVYATRWGIVYGTYGNSLEEVKEKIEEFENEMNRNKIRNIYEV